MLSLKEIFVHIKRELISWKIDPIRKTNEIYNFSHNKPTQKLGVFSIQVSIRFQI